MTYGIVGDEQSPVDELRNDCLVKLGIRLFLSIEKTKGNIIV